METTALPRVSVVMPAYNARAYIARALASVLEQTEARVEVIVVDDGSTDGTAEVAVAAAGGDGRVRVLRHAVNRGPGAARNTALDAARGEWVALLDADDRFAPDRIAHLLALAERTGADMVSDNLLLCPEDGARPDQPMIPARLLPRAQRLTTAEFVRRNVGHRRAAPRFSYGFMQPLFRRHFLDAHRIRYDEANRFGEDYLLYLRCLAQGARWWVTPEPLYLYTLRRGSLTEVQGTADVLRILAADQALLDDPAVAADRALAAALRRHQRALERSRAYRAFANAAKAAEFRRALGLLLGSRRTARHIVQESLVQAPVILRKALRGGYRAPRDPIPHFPGTPRTGGRRG